MNPQAEKQRRILQLIIQEVIKQKAKTLPKKKKKSKKQEEKNPLDLPLPPYKTTTPPIAPTPQSPRPQNISADPGGFEGIEVKRTSRFPRSRGALGRAIINKQIKAQPQSIPEEEGLEKLTPFLNDPAVQSMECVGSGQALIINRFGVKQKASLSLTNEEINELLQTFSEKTHISLNQGVFKATLGKLTLTAVVSEFVGTRFILFKTKN
ncbi:hypothetical protein CMI48_04730 [Candidatus Pacearchaeota archaeon]|nr:hypothetical protein [Candidatus Pacearchaeota archaeon]|tara:strand:+ start:36 stop:662 length:627 start_codon:yes stop_codon:yes gene_type:complete